MKKPILYLNIDKLPQPKIDVAAAVWLKKLKEWVNVEWLIIPIRKGDTRIEMFDIGE